MWRPDNWGNPYGNEWWTSACQHQYNLGEAFEVGADALLGALREQGIPPEIFECYLRNAFVNFPTCPDMKKINYQGVAGTLVFIPDEDN